MKIQHTKGKWGVRSAMLGEDITYETGILATVYRKVNNIQESEANAKLIAAAPDLLEALIELKIMAEGNNSNAYEIAEIAIKKATK